jgi:hypothetical protein
LRHDQPCGAEPKPGKGSDQRGKWAKGWTRFHVEEEISARAPHTFDAEFAIPSLRLVAVEEPDPVTLAQECSQRHEKNENLNLPCRHAITSFP